MTQGEKDNLTTILTPHFGEKTPSVLVQMERGETGKLPPEIVGQSIDRWIQEFSITGADKTYLEGFYTRYNYTPGDDDMG